MEIGAINELKPTCILDIYVHQSYQRHGIGKVIIDIVRKSLKIPTDLECSTLQSGH